MTKKNRTFDVIKASGKTEKYNPGKILNSLIRAGADISTAEKILAEAEPNFHPGISTKKIFNSVMKLLEEKETGAACLYDLKGSIRRLGPSGYPFETYVGEILREYGKKVKIRQVIKGRCATHEIDIVAESKREGLPYIELVECKYSTTAGNLVDLKEMMYTWARLQDINEYQQIKHPFDGIVVFSNNRASGEALKYAACKGVSVVSWKYPPENGLEEMIKVKNLYPVTILPSAASIGAELFSRAELMLVKDFTDQDPRELSFRLHLPISTITGIIREAEMLLGRTDQSC